MDPYESQKPQTVSWWIASLAISVVICTGFAGYVFDIKEDLDNAKIRADIMEQRMDMLTSQVENVRRHAMLQMVPAEKTATPPAASVAPIPEAQPVGTVPAPQPVPSSPPVTPPVMTPAKP